MKINLKYFWRILILTASFIFGYVIRGCDDRLFSERVPVIRTDTLSVRDTVADRNPDVAQLTADSLLLLKLPSLPNIPDIGYVPDTVYKRDTVYVPARWVQLRYDKPDYRAWVSGYQLGGRSPQLDSVYVYPETRYVTRETISMEPRKRWGIGIQAGYGIGISSGQVKAFPYIGVGISYDLVRW